MEGVQKDVRRTVSVMQYNILASWPAPETFPQQLEIRGETKSKTQIEKRKLHKCLAFFGGLVRYLGKNTQPWFLYGADIEPEAGSKR